MEALMREWNFERTSLKPEPKGPPAPRPRQLLPTHGVAKQLRVWVLESGIPVALGCIDAQSRKSELMDHFKAAMPKTGEEDRTFRLRPVDQNGREVGQEITLVIKGGEAF